MDRHIVISVDGHAFGPSPANSSSETKQLSELDDYFEGRFLSEWKSYRVALHEQLAPNRGSPVGDDSGLFASSGVGAFEAKAGARGSDAADGLFDSDIRIRELHNEGISAEVIFPNPLPFEMDGKVYPRELRQAGHRAYNRWIADFCARTPNQRAGLAVLDPYDVDGAVKDVGCARENGLRGVIIPTGWYLEGLEPYYDDRYEPLWAACAENRLPVHLHGGAGSGDDITRYGAKGFGVHAVEAVMFYGSRAFPYFVFGGVLERYPDLQLVFTESRGPWIETLRLMDNLVDERTFNDLFAHVRQGLSLKASEYFRRQVFLGASMMSRTEALSRHEIGLENLMWGADYPHVEGTWPQTSAWLRSAFGGLPTDEVHTILAVNPARLYGFDLEQLQPIADRVGPHVNDLAEPPEETLWEW